MEWQNPYKNLHPTLIPKMKPLTIHKKAKYTGHRPAKFSSSGGGSPHHGHRGRHNKYYSSASHARESAFDKKVDTSDKFAANQSRSVAKTYFDNSTKAGTEKMSGTAGAATAQASGLMTAEGARSLAPDPEVQLLSTVSNLAYQPGIDPTMTSEVQTKSNLKEQGYQTKSQEEVTENVQ